MKKRMWTRIISGALVGVMMMTMFTGCDNKKEEEYVEGEASEVSFNTDGKFTTTLTMEDGSFPENIAASDVSVGYSAVDEEGLTKEMTAENHTDQTEVDASKYISDVNATVDSVTRKDEHTLEITFTDEKVAENVPDSYGIMIDKDKSGAGKILYASAGVTYPNHTLTSNVESVSVLDQDIRLTLSLNEGEYAADVSKEDVTL